MLVDRLHFIVTTVGDTTKGDIVNLLCLSTSYGLLCTPTYTAEKRAVADPHN